MWYKKPESKETATVFLVDKDSNLLIEYKSIPKKLAEKYVDQRNNFQLNYMKG